VSDPHQAEWRRIEAGAAKAEAYLEAQGARRLFELAAKQERRAHTRLDRLVARHLEQKAEAQLDN